MDNGGLGSYEVIWHTDNSYVEVPPAGSMLYSLEIPAEGGGGDTSFSNQYRAYEELADDLKRAIEGRYQVHDSSRNSAGVLRPGVKLPTKPEEVEGPTHPLVRVHPVTGKRALYLGRRRVWPSNYIVGIPNDESERLLARERAARESRAERAARTGERIQHQIARFREQRPQPLHGRRGGGGLPLLALAGAGHLHRHRRRLLRRSRHVGRGGLDRRRGEREHRAGYTMRAGALAKCHRRRSRQQGNAPHRDVEGNVEGIHHFRASVERSIRAP